MDFAELQRFIESPLRTYSSGMQMRLAFPVAVHTAPEILLIDEVLAVGDASFQRKCLEHIARFKAEGCAIILVSHDTTLIQQLCDEVVWLRAGRIIAQGNSAMVVGQYLDEQSTATRRRTPIDWPAQYTRTGTELRVNEDRFGSLELEITDVRLLDPAGFPATELERGDPLRVEIDYLSPQPVPAPIFGVTITREDGSICCDTSTAGASLIPPTVHGRGRITLYLERLDLEGGQYYVDVGVYETGWAYAYDYHWHVYPLLIHAPEGHLGVLRPPHRWAVGDPPASEGGVPALKALE